MKLRAEACTIATDQPESDGTLEWDATTIVIVEADEGIGYTYADASAADVVERVLAPVIEDPDAIEGAWWAMARALRNIGRRGIGSHALSAVDIALWDRKAKRLGLPLYGLLGAVRDRVPVYGSGGFCSYDDETLAAQLRGWVDAGIERVKMKVGRDPEADEHRVAVAREAIGDAGLMVDANGAWTVAQAIDCAQRWDVTWVEEPVSSDDVEGLREIKHRVRPEVAAGEYGYTPDDFARLIGAVDVLQADVTRCGGVTGMLKVGALCTAHDVPLSAHTCPSVHAHLGCAIEPLRDVEYFHDHARIEQMLFDGAAQPVDGALHPSARPGLGIARC